MAEKYLQKCERSPNGLNSVAWAFSCNKNQELLDYAESWAREAVAKVCESTIKPSQRYLFEHTFAMILGARNKWKEALSLAPNFLIKAVVLDFMEDINEFFFLAAAAGHIKEPLQRLQESEIASDMEPLVIALRTLNREKVIVAQEIKEIANNIIKKIEEKQKKIPTI